MGETPVWKRRWFKVTLIAVGGMLVLLLLLVLLLPSFISSNPGTRWALGLVNDSIKGKLVVDDLSIGWTSGPTLRNVKVLGPGGEVIATVDEVVADDTSLLSLARGSKNYGKVRVVHPVADLVQGEDGRLNIAKAFEPTKPSPPKAEEKSAGQPLEGLKLDFALENGSITYAAPEMDPIQISGLNVTATIDTVQQIQLLAKADILQAGEQGKLDVKANLAGIVDTAGQVQYDTGQIEADAALTGFPIVSADRLLNMNGKLEALLGPTLTASVTSRGVLKDLHANINVESRHLGANATLIAKNGHYTTDPDAQSKPKITLTVTPEAWKLLTAQEGRTQTELTEAVNIVIEVGQLAGQVKDKKLDLLSVVGTVTLTISDIVLDTGEKFGTLAMRGTHGDVSFDGPRDAKLDASLQSIAHHGERQGGVELSVNMLNALLADGSFNKAGFHADIKGRITDWPLPLIDELTQQNGLLTKALGEVLNARVTANLKPIDDGDGVAGPFSLTANADRLSANLTGNVTPGRLIIASGSDAVLTVTDALLKHFTTAPITLTSNVTVVAAFREVIYPLGKSADKAALHADLTFSDAQLLVGEKQEFAALTGTRIAADSDDLTQSLKASVRSTVGYGGQQSNISVDADVAKPFTAEGRLNKQEMTTDANAQAPDLPLAIVDHVAELDGLAAAALGHSLTLTLITHTQYDTKINDNVTTFKATARSQQLSTEEVHGTLTPTTLAIDPGATVRLRLMPEALTVAQRGKENPMALAEPADLNAVLGGIKLPRGEQRDLGQTEIEASLTIDQLVLAPTADVPAVSLRDARLSVPKTTLGQDVLITLDAQVVAGDRSDKLTVRATGHNVLSAQRSGRVEIQDAPVALLDHLGGQGGRLVRLLGDRIDSVVLSAQTPEKNQPLDFGAELKSPRIKATVAGQYDEKNRSVTVADKSFVEYELTGEALPELVAAATQQKLELVSPALLRLDIETFSTVLRPKTPEAPETAPAPVASADAQAPKPLPIDAARTAIKATLKSLSPMAFRVTDVEGKQDITDLSVAINTDPSLADQVRLDATGNFVSYGGDGRPGSPQPFNSNTVVRNLYTADSTLNSAGLSLTTDTKLNDASSALITALAGLGKEHAQALGPTVSVHAKGDYPGQLEATVQSKNVQLRAPLVADDARNVTLSDDLTGQMEINSDTRVLLGRMSPMLVDASDANKPAKLRVKKESFIAPLGQQPFDIAKVKASGTVELDQVTLNQSWVVKEYAGILGGVAGVLGKTLGGVGELLNIVGSQVGLGKDVTKALGQLNEYSKRVERLTGGATPYQFTPVLFDLNNGVLKTEDTWMRSPDLMVGVRGNVNLTNKALDAKLGMPGRSLSAPVPMLSELGVIDPNRIYEFKITRAGDGQPQLKQEDKTAFLGAVGDILGTVLKFVGPRDKSGVTSALTLPPDWSRMPKWPEQEGLEEEQTPAQQTPQESTPAQQPQQQPTDQEQPKKRDPIKQIEELLGL